MNPLFKLVIFVCLLMLCTVFVVGLVLGSELVDFKFQLPSVNQSSEQHFQPQLSPDMQRYFELKNLSCATLSGNFLIVTEDASLAELSGMVPLIPEEETAAKYLIESYSFNQTTRTYSRGDWLKKVIEENGKPDRTLLWKNGRMYYCSGNNCSMELLSDSDSDKYYDSLSEMRTSCMYFAKTPLPENVNVSRLLEMKNSGLMSLNVGRCEMFVITTNSTYAREVFDSGNLTENQKALFWALSNLAAPIQECLDESTGIVVSRVISFDLKDSYLLDFASDGQFLATQKTNLKYFSTNVPESFLTLPEQSE